MAGHITASHFKSLIKIWKIKSLREGSFLQNIMAQIQHWKVFAHTMRFFCSLSLSCVVPPPKIKTFAPEEQGTLYDRGMQYRAHGGREKMAEIGPLFLHEWRIFGSHKDCLGSHPTFFYCPCHILKLAEMPVCASRKS